VITDYTYLQWFSFEMLGVMIWRLQLPGQPWSKLAVLFHVDQLMTEMSGKRLHIQSQPYQAQPSALRNFQPYDSQNEISYRFDRIIFSLT
jgi:hypothetical protein